MMSTPSRQLPTEPLSLHAGDEMPPSTFGPVTRTDLVRYAGAGGDFNPNHHDEPFAQSAGMPSVFGMGLFHAGLLGHRLARWVGPLNIERFAVRFTGQVWPGDVLAFSAQVSSVDADKAQIQLLVTRNHTEPVLTGLATVRRRGDDN